MITYIQFIYIALGKKLTRVIPTALNSNLQFNIYTLRLVYNTVKIVVIDI